MDERWMNTKATLQDLESKLKCFVCKKQAASPHVLSCKHTYCKECILPMDWCPKCGFPITSQDLVPDIILSHLLRAINEMQTDEEIQITSIKQQPKEELCKTTSLHKNDGNNIKDCYIDTPNSSNGGKIPSETFSVRRTRSRPPSKGNRNSYNVVSKESKCVAISENVVEQEVKTTTSLTPLSKSKSTDKMNSLKSNLLFSAKKSSGLIKTNAKGETPLQIACRQGKISLVKRLLEEGAEPNVKDNANWTPLSDAVYSGNIDVVKTLLEAGACVNTPCNENTTALIEAILRKDKSIVELLVNYGADIHQRTALNNTAWSIACDEMKTLLLKSDIKIQPHPRIKATPRAVMVNKLPEQNVNQVLRLCKKFNLPLSLSFTEEVTHVIVEKTAENTCEGSTDVMLAILSGCSVIGMDWVHSSMEAEQLLAADVFEPLGTIDYPNSDVFHKSRLNKEQLLPRLFDGCHISLQHDQKWQPEQKQELMTLITSAGAQFQPRECDAERIPLSEQTVMYHADPESSLGQVSHVVLFQPGSTEPLLKYNMAHVKSFPVSWFFKCIKTFSILPP